MMKKYYVYFWLCGQYENTRHEIEAEGPCQAAELAILEKISEQPDSLSAFIIRNVKVASGKGESWEFIARLETTHTPILKWIRP